MTRVVVAAAQHFARMRASASCSSSSSSSQRSRNTPSAGKKPVQKKPPTTTNDLSSSRGRNNNRRRRRPRAVAEEEQQKIPPANENKTTKTAHDDEIKDVEDKYNEAMKAYSASPFEYQHEKGLYYHQITDSILVGTQPWEKGSIGYLKEKENVTVLFNTQEDGNFAYWKVDIGEREAEAREANVLLHRQPIVDFSFDSLREQLPEAASEFDRLMHRSEEEVIYCHCTAGMGRSPAVVIAYLYWTDDRFESLDAAYEFLTSKRPCGPKKEAIRQATVDILESEGDSLPTRDGRMKVDAGRYYGDDSKKLKDEEKNLDSRGTTLTKAQRETIKKKLRVKSGLKKKSGGVLEILKRFFLGAGPTDD
jgi:protein-tyrosine phosphatase